MNKKASSTSKKRDTRVLSALCLGLILAPGAAFAAEPEGTTVLEEVVVTATRTERRPIDVPITTEIISQEEIQLSGANDMGELLSKHMTGHIHKYSGLLTGVGIRGMRTDVNGADLDGYVLILIDGHRVGTGNAAKINMDRIERVEITKGPASALYGSSAMGGVVNLITKKGDGDLGGSLGFEYGSFDYFKALGTLGGEVNDNLRFFITASGDKVGDFDTPDYGTTYNSGTDKFNFGGNVTYSFNENHEVRIGGNYAHLVTEIPSYPLERHTLPHYLDDYKEYADKSIGYADLEYNGSWLDGSLRWKGLIYYLYDKNHSNSPQYGYQYGWGSADPKSSQTKTLDKTWGTDHQFTWKMNGWNTLLAGFLLDSTDRESSRYDNFKPADAYSPNLQYDNQAVFIQDSLDLWDNRINIVLASRYDRFDLTTKAAQTVVGSTFSERSEDFGHFSPKIAVSLKSFDDRLRLRGSYSEGFKSPTAPQLSADYTDMSYGYPRPFIGNPDLDPETSRTYGFGIDFFLDAFTAKFDLYRTDWKNKIQQTTVENTNIQTWENIDNAKISGIDLLLEWQINKTFTELPFRAKLWSNMTFVLDNKDKTTKKEMKYISDYEIKSGLNFGWGDFNSQLSFVIIGEQEIDDFYSGNWPAPVVTKSSFNFWDLTMSYTIADHWEIKAGVYNLFNQSVEWVDGYPMPERNYRIGLTYKF